MGERSAYEDYRKLKLETGMQYQDFVVDCCWNLLGLAVVQYSSKLYQQTVGESKTGVEIKHDERLVDTGNLWIEISEKARPRHGDYAQSGIFRDDNTWLYIIGNYDTIFIFAKKMLRGLYRSGRYATRENGTKTSEGFLLPENDAKKFSAQILYPNASQQVGKTIEDLSEESRRLYSELISPTGGQLDLFAKH